MPPAGLAKDAAGNVEGYEIFIKYLPYDTQEDDLATFFSECGEIVGKPRLMRHAQSGQCKGIGWITFASQAAFTTALSWDGCSYGSRNLSLSAGKAQHTGIRPSLQAPGTHTPALFREVVRDVVGKNVDGVYVDGTFGRGGHTRGILSALSPKGRLHAFDMDPEVRSVGPGPLARARREQLAAFKPPAVDRRHSAHGAAGDPGGQAAGEGGRALHHPPRAVLLDASRAEAARRRG